MRKQGTADAIQAEMVIAHLGKAAMEPHKIQVDQEAPHGLPLATTVVRAVWETVVQARLIPVTTSDPAVAVVVATTAAAVAVQIASQLAPLAAVAAAVAPV